MATTFEDLLAILKRWDEVSVLELLNLSTEDVVDAFSDLIYDNQEFIRAKLAIDDDEDEA